MQNYSRKYTLVLDFELNLVLVLKLILRLFKFLKTENYFHFGPVINPLIKNAYMTNKVLC